MNAIVSKFIVNFAIFFNPASIFDMEISRFVAQKPSKFTKPIISSRDGSKRTIAGRGAQGDVLLRSGDLLGRHFEEFVDVWLFVTGLLRTGESLRKKKP